MGEKEKKIDEIGALRESRHTASLTEGEHLGAVSELARLVGDFGSTLQLDEILANVS